MGETSTGCRACHVPEECRLLPLQAEELRQLQEERDAQQQVPCATFPLNPAVLYPSPG